MAGSAATLGEIGEAFLSLSEPDRILLLDYLAAKGGIEIDTQKAARDWASAKWDDEDRVAYEAERLIPQGFISDQSVWKLHDQRTAERLTLCLRHSDRIAA